MSDPKTTTLDVPNAVLTYDVRGHDASAHPVLLLIGSPMGARGFATLAGHFEDRTVVTYDPRGAERSPRTDDAGITQVEEHADDLHRLIEAVSDQPVDVFATSGGAVNALALVAKHPGQVRTLVAHEPPSAVELPDADLVQRAFDDMAEAYQREGLGAGMARFIALVSQQGPITEAYLEQPAPDPAMFGLPTQDDGKRGDALLQLNAPCPRYRHDFDALRAASTRIVIAVGETSGEAIPARAGRAVAERIGIEPTGFPGDHGGFSGGEYGQPGGEPDAFGVRLREVLDGS